MTALMLFGPAMVGIWLSPEMSLGTFAFPPLMVAPLIAGAVLTRTQLRAWPAIASLLVWLFWPPLWAMALATWRLGAFAGLLWLVSLGAAVRMARIRKRLTAQNLLGRDQG